MAQSRDNPPTVPKGWKAIFDDEYKTWFYVDLSTEKSQWEAPKGTTWSKNRPDGPPPYSRDDNSNERATQSRDQNSGYQRQQPQPQQQQQRSYQQQQPMYQQQQPMYQQPMYQQPVYQQPVYQQPVYQQQPQRSNHGTRNGLLGAGAGLLGGFLLADALEGHHGGDTIVENNYYDDNNNNDYDNGYDGGYDGGFDDGGFDGGF